MWIHRVNAQAARPAYALGWHLLGGIHSLEAIRVFQETWHGREEKSSEREAEEAKQGNEGLQGSAQQQPAPQAQMNTGPGMFGPLTEGSLKKFQKAHGVEAIGVYGPKTRAAFVKLGAKLGRVPKPPPSGHKNPFLAQFQRALAKLRLPKSWATSEALWQLIQHESSWNPRAKNPSSTAFGLFQFLKSTWATYCKEGPYGSPNPYIQALGGFRYIKSRYRTPKGAWAFWQRHHWY